MTTFFFQNSYVPSGSMEPNFYIGDVVVIGKVYGARMPRILRIPLTEKTIWGTKIPSYLSLPLPYFRFPGIASPTYGDAIVFNAPVPEEDVYPVEVKTYFIKRLIALPGDFISINKEKVYINDKLEPAKFRERRKYLYKVKTNKLLYSLFFEKYNIKEEDHKVMPGGYYIYMPPKVANQMRSASSVLSIEMAEAHDKRVHYLPRFRIPKTGMKIQLDDISMKKEVRDIYINLILRYESHQHIEKKGHHLYIDGKKVKEYCFQQNFYFAGGDNYHNSMDSRMIGCIPEQNIEGKAVYRLLGAKNGLKKGDEWWRKLFIIPLLRGHFSWKRSFQKVS